MSRYEELEQAVREDHNRRQEYEDRCKHFIVELRDELVEYLGCGREKLKWFVPSNRDIFSDQETGLIEAMALKPDGFLHVGLAVLIPVPGTMSTRAAAWRLLVKNLDGKFTIQIGEDGQSLSIPESPELERSKGIGAVCDQLFEDSLRNIEEGFTTFLREGGTSELSGIGFHESS